jgi:hypothetical protein
MGCDDYGDTTAGTGAPWYAQSQTTNMGGPELVGGPLKDEEDHNLAKMIRATALAHTELPTLFVINERDNKIIYEFINIPHEEAYKIIVLALPKVLNLWLEKTADYGDDHALDLGPKGEFVRIWNKVHKLKRALWDGRHMAGEQTDEILSDLIGHSLRILGRIWGSPKGTEGV